MPVPLAIVGAGSRGNTYARSALRHGGRIVAVVDPDPAARDAMGDGFDVPAEHRFVTVDELTASPVACAAAVNASPDRAHLATFRSLVEHGLDVLQEKPVGVDLDEIAALRDLARRHADRVLAVCHVLRYTDLYREVRRIVSSGELGDVVTVHHSENIAYWHFAHSYVRGNWRSAVGSAPMILAKCCHDLDVLAWILDDDYERVGSIGSLRHFRVERAPAGSPLRCTDGCPVAETCDFDAVRFYGGPQLQAVASNPILARDLARLDVSPYGRCVYRCDNDVPDHQIATFEMRSGRSLTLTISGHAAVESRVTRIDGTRASLVARLCGAERRITIEHRGRPAPDPVVVDVSARDHDADDGHGGGDDRIVAQFLHDVRHRTPSASDLLGSLAGHVAALAAETARVEGGTVDVSALGRAHRGAPTRGSS